MILMINNGDQAPTITESLASGICDSFIREKLDNEVHRSDQGNSYSCAFIFGMRGREGGVV